MLGKSSGGRNRCATLCAHARILGTHLTLARTNLTLPQELLAEVDQLAGPRGRSRYVAEAVAQRVKRDRLGLAIRDSAGAVQADRLSRDQVSALIQKLRSEESS